MRSPAVYDFFCLSEPAKSTKFNLENFIKLDFLKKILVN